MSSLPQIRGDRVLRRARKLLSGYDAVSLRALLHAACSSPTARQAKATCTVLLLSCWQAPPSGSSRAAAGDLPKLVKKLRRAAPEVASVEDFMPLDPRLVVCFRARRGEKQWRFRLHPGSLESPLDLLRRLANYADALDPAMQAQAGFGIGDMLDIAGAMLDNEFSLLAPAWSDASVAVDSRPFVTQAEVDAVAGYLRDWSADALLSGEQSATGQPEQQDRAAQALTVPADRLSFAPGPFSPTLGPGVIVDTQAGRFPVPAGLVLEGLDCAVARILAAFTSPDKDSETGEHPGGPPVTGNAQRADSGQEAEDRWRANSWSEFEVICRGLPTNVLHGTAESGQEMVVIATGHRHVLAVELVAALAARDVAGQVAAARERLAGFRPGSLFRASAAADFAEMLHSHDDDEVDPSDAATGDGLTWPAGFADALPFPASLFDGEPVPLAPGTDVTRLIVVDGAWQPGQLWSGGIPACTLDEFRVLLTEHTPTSTDCEELWAFLDELTNLGATSDGSESGVRLWFYSVLDAWAVWRARGVLFPAWLPQPTIGRLTPHDIEPAWARAARLDAVDDLLADRDLPGIQSWTTALQTPVPAIDPTHGPCGWVTTLTLTSPRIVLFVCPDQPLIVTVDLEFRDGLTFSRAQMVTLTNTVQDTLYELARAEPEAWAVWRETHEHHPATIAIRPRRLPEDSPAVRLGVVILGDEAYELWCDPAKLTGADGTEIHRQVGEALQAALLARRGAPAIPDDTPAEAASNPSAAPPEITPGTDPRAVDLDLSQEDVDRVEIFSGAWRRLPPRIFLRRSEMAFQPYSTDTPQTLTDGGKSRAARAAARQLSGELTAGNHPISAVIRQICPATMQALHQAAQPFEPQAALAAVCGEVERAFNDRFTAVLAIETSAAAPWEQDPLHSMFQADAYQEAMTRTRVAELLAECLLYQQPRGHLMPDRRDVHRLLDHAHAALEASLIAQQAYAAIRPARVTVSELGDIAIIDEPPGSPRIDIGAWQDAQLGASRSMVGREQADLGDVSAAEHPDGQLPAEERTPFRSLRAVLEEQRQGGGASQVQDAADMLEVDDALLAEFGFGFDNILAVLAAVSSWRVPREPHAPIGRIRRGSLVDDIVAWSRLDQAQVERAVDACTLTAEILHSEGLPYWQLEQRRARLALRPLIRPAESAEDPELWLLPGRAHATQRVWARYLDDRRLPWPDKDLPRMLLAAVDKWRRHAEDRLEKLAAAAAAASGLPCRPRLTARKAAKHGLNIPGEIDLLVADPQARQIWVVEAKHLSEPFGSMEMAIHLAKFDGPAALAFDDSTHQFRQFRTSKFRPYNEILLEKVGAVQRDIGAALRSLGTGCTSAAEADSELPDEAGHGWQVTGVYVTGHIEIAAFAAHPKFPFVSIDRFGQFLAGPPPRLGWWEPTEEHSMTGTCLPAA